MGGLVKLGGKYYGTTTFGGAYNYGTVYSIDRNGKEKVIYSFTGGADGNQPSGELIVLNGMLYGTTKYGGVGVDTVSGTVFSVTPNGAEKVIHGFVGGKSDGDFPLAALTNVNGILYGTTYFGGQHNAGTVFAVNPDGSEQVIHSIKPKPEGKFPVIPGAVSADSSSAGGAWYCAPGWRAAAREAKTYPNGHSLWPLV